MNTLMTRRWAVLGLALLSGMLIAAGLQESDAPFQPLGRQARPFSVSAALTPAPLDPAMTSAQTAFAIKLFQTVAAEKPNQNLLISPLSVQMALAMTYTGSAGSTQTAMAKALSLEGAAPTVLNQHNQILLSQLIPSPDPQVQITMANSLWAREGIPLQPAFVEQSRTAYQAEITSLPFDPAGAVRINGWVAGQTKGKIPSIVDQLSPDQILLLINAVYFKGEWSQSFNPQATQSKPFTRFDGSQRSHPLMSQSGTYEYLETPQFQALQLPYGKKDWRMVIVLPKAGIPVTQVTGDLDPSRWQQWMQSFQSRPGSVQLPRFQLSSELNLVPALSRLGMGVAFSGQADFSRMTTVPALISEVKHKSVMEVNEQGTEAAAVTSVGISRTSLGGKTPPPFQMVVDRPFLTVIQHSQTGSLLFLGVVGDPAQES